ncbi:TDP-N-acetylfucosamine:lipid II N-acetylfucosaminyltransferase [Flavobacterium sp. N1736]|uniref:TDP-N-acetylfucosamine:lipid II N-acetylfucosaminyltransferase n=1 Tax=Flavobacterium sp. N1736 TaxID=2986823 RepID=UPI0022242FE5|nr:TDP-N-acetylfucosamine:lipid II N-acetylfucosaminyltransferase [Flavobacterium sp. N1736]
MNLHNNSKIIHVFDDDKFIDPAIKLFESVYPGISEYWIIKNQGGIFQYVTSKIVKTFDPYDKESFKSFIEKINEIEDPIVFFHALEQTKQKIALEISPKITKVWFIWGYDLYGNWPLLRKEVFKKNTKSYINKTQKEKVKDKLLLNNFAFWIFKNDIFFRHILPLKLRNVLQQKYNTIFYQAAKKMDIVVPVIYGELKILKKMDIKAIYAPFTYGSIEGLLGDKINENVLGKQNILVGNSADPSNNHLEILQKLSKINLNNKKIYVPLSYGGNEDYKQHIIRKGKELFGENFIPLTDFMSLKEYNEILLSCGILVFNHVRQQGVGNIITMGYLGAKIFINSKSPVYETYKTYGIKIFNLNKLDKNILIPLNNQEYELNKRLLFNLYSEEAVKNKIIELFKIVNKMKIEKHDY